MCPNFSNKKLKKERKTKKDKQEDHIEHIPFKLREIMKNKDRMKKGSFRAKKLKKGKWKYFYKAF